MFIDRGKVTFMKRCISFTLAVVAWTLPAFGDEEAAARTSVAQPASERFADSRADEVPNFRQHVVPLMGKLGCNGRACHGSFQGQGGFRLSLFGYDFQLDHDGLTKAEGDKEARVDREFPEDSLMLLKPTMALPHKGGKRLEEGGWEYNVFLTWIKGGAKGVQDDDPEFERIEVTPSELVFDKAGSTAQLRVVAVWSDGAREDVTPLCRFQTNDGQVAEINEAGVVTAGQPGDTHVVVFYDNGVMPIPVMRPVSDRVGPKYPEMETPTEIDRLIVAKLRKLGIVPSAVATDAEFLRRVRLDLTGSLPTPDEVAAFLSDSSPDKRARKIDELLETPAYAAWWTTRLCDYTGNSDDALVNVTPVRSQASQDWYDWIYQRVAENVPYDEIVAGIVTATSLNPGETYAEYCENMSALYQRGSEESFADREFMPHYWARRTFRQPDDRAIGFAYSFLGIRIECARCHKHPFDQWTQDDFKEFTGFFRRVNFNTNPEHRDEYKAMIEELDVGKKRGNQLRRELADLLRDGKTVPFQEVYAVKPRGNQNARRGNNRRNRNRNAGPSQAKLLGGAVIDLNEYEDARTPLMKWLRSKDNPLFAKAFVNRVWAAYFHRGIVEPPDDLSLANPPSNAALLDYLARGFIDNDFDMKWLHREITNSDAYQRSWTPNETNRQDERNFSRAVPRRLPAEVAYDAIQQATSSDEEIAAMHRDVSDRAISIPGAGRRNNRGPGYALTIFGRSVRESNCDCDRSSEASLLQTVFLQNDEEVLGLINRNRGGWVNQAADELGVDRRQAQSPDKPKNFGRQAASLRKRIQNARRDGNKQQVKKLQRTLAALRRRYDRENAASTTSKGKQARGTADLEEIINRTYLRTLSRYPSEDEMSQCRQFVEQSETPVEGVRGLLWALINTKEFIVNH